MRTETMTTVSTRTLKDQLSSYLHRVEDGERIVVLRRGRAVAALVPLGAAGPGTEDEQLAALEARGLVIRPPTTSVKRFRPPLVPARGKLASEMVIEDRR